MLRPRTAGDLLTEAGLEVARVRPRTMLSPSMVDHVLRKDPSAIMRLVRARTGRGGGGLRIGRDGEGPGNTGDESFGIYLLAAARKPGASAPRASAQRASAQGASAQKAGARGPGAAGIGTAGPRRAATAPQPAG